MLIGLQYGDEGKGKIIDAIIAEYGIVARFNGGPNAGHTLVHDGKEIVLHQIPSGIFHPDKLLYIGSGCVLNLEKLMQEIEAVKELGISLEGRLVISDQVSIIQPDHIYLDGKNGGGLGTTGNGIGPAYEDKAQRYKNSRLTDLLDDPANSRDKIIEYYKEAVKLNSRMSITSFLTSLFQQKSVDIVNKADTIIDLSQQLQQYICRDPLWLVKQVESGKNVLFEGAQAVMLDVVHGTVPYVTSSHTIAGSAYVGGDLPPRYHRKTIGVAKAIMSRVGHGPFVSEFGEKRSENYCMENGGKKYTKEYEQNNYRTEDLLKTIDWFNIGIALRMMGGEYGATTKRPRRLGMFDLVQLAYACKTNGVDELYVTKVDCLKDFARTPWKNIPVVEAYTANGLKITYNNPRLPTSTQGYSSAKPIVRFLSSFTENISSVRNYDNLPQQVKEFISHIERAAGCPVKGIGVGPDREQTILR